jgi:hypothetical protein
MVGIFSARQKKIISPIYPGWPPGTFDKYNFIIRKHPQATAWPVQQKWGLVTATKSHFIPK